MEFIIELCLYKHKKIAFGNKGHTTNKKMGVSVLLRLSISSNKVYNATYALLRLQQNSIFKFTTTAPMIPKEMEYSPYYGDVRGDVLPLPHGTNTSSIVIK